MNSSDFVFSADPGFAAGQHPSQNPPTESFPLDPALLPHPIDTGLFSPSSFCADSGSGLGDFSFAAGPGIHNPLQDLSLSNLSSFPGLHSSSLASSSQLPAFTTPVHSADTLPPVSGQPGSHRKCTILNCPRLCLSKKCGRQQCASHCQRQSTPCTYSGHNKYRGKTTTSAFSAFSGPAKPASLNPTVSSLSVDSLQPLPSSSSPATNSTSASPIGPLPSSSGSQDLPSATRTFAKDFNQAWQMDWAGKKRARDLKMEAEGLRRENERMMASTVIIWWWNTVSTYNY